MSSHLMLPLGACNSKKLTCVNKKYKPTHHWFVCAFSMAECSDYCYCYNNMFVSQLITYNSVLSDFTLSITYLIQGALYAFKADINSVLGFCLGLYVLERSQLLKGVSISCIGRV